MKISNFLMVIFLSAGMLFLTSCGGDDDDNPEECTQVQTIGGSVEINGDAHALTIAQLIVNGGGAVFGDSYVFQVAAIDGDCSTVKTVSFTLSIPSGSELNGTYDIKDFFSASDGDAYGTYAESVLDPVSQFSTDLASGTVEIVKGSGNTTYTIDLEANTTTGDDVRLEMTHEF